MEKRRLPLWPYVPPIAVFIIAILVFVATSLFGGSIDIRLGTPVTEAGLKGDPASTIRFAAHRNEIAVTGRATPTSTVTVRINGVVEGTVYVPADGHTFEFAHVPMPTNQVSVLQIDGFLWHGIKPLSARGTTYAIVNPVPLLQKIELLVLRSDTSGNATARGSGTPGATLVVYDAVNPKLGATVFPPANVLARIRIDANGNFNVPILLATGTHQMWGATANCDVLACASTPVQKLEVDRAVPPPDQFLPQRAMTLQVGYKRLSVDVTAKLPRDDIIAQQVIEGNRGDVIVPAIYGETTINGKPIDRFFADIVPTYELAGDAITVHMRSEPQRPDDTTLPTMSGRVIISETPDFGPGHTWDRDTVTVHLTGYELALPQPAPDATAADGSVSWDHAFAADGGRIAMTLAFTPWRNFSTVHEFLLLSVFAIFPHIVARFVALISGLLFAIPMLVYLAMTRRKKKPSLRVAARLLTAICVAPDLFLALATSQPDANNLMAKALGANPADITVIDLSAPLLCAVGIGVTALAAAGVFDRWKSTAWGVVLRESAVAVAIASALFALSAYMTFWVHGVMHVEAPSGFVYVTELTVLLAAASTLVLGTCGFYKHSSGATAWRFIAFVAVLTLFEAVPVALHRYVLWASSPALNATILNDFSAPTGLVLDYLRQTTILCNFSFGLALIATAFLHRGNGLGSRQLLRLALCAYAIASTVNVFLVPVSFILAWYTFDFVLDRKRVLQGIAETVRRERGRIVMALLLRSKTDVLIAKMRDLTNKHIDDLDDTTFAKRRAFLQTLIDEEPSEEIEYAFGVAPHDDPRANGTIGLPVAAVFVSAHVLLFLATETASLRVAHSAYTLLVVAGYLSAGLASFVVPAFVFGACFELIRGRSALQKAITVGAWAIACSLPSWLVSLPSFTAVLAIAVETALFYTVLGFVYDVVILRESRSIPFRISDVPKLSGVPALSWAGTVALASFGVALNGVLSGKFQNVVTSAITSVYQQATLGQ